jgi:hypothetical protein
MSLRALKNVSVGSAADGSGGLAMTSRLSVFSCAMIAPLPSPPGPMSPTTLPAGAGATGLGDRLVAADVIAVHVVLTIQRIG